MNSDLENHQVELEQVERGLQEGVHKKQESLLLRGYLEGITDKAVGENLTIGSHLLKPSR